MIDVNRTVELIDRNGWTTGRKMIWAQVVIWCVEHVPSFKRKNWIERARRAFHKGNGERLGKMIGWS